MKKKKPSQKTLQEVYNRWNGRCAFCGIDLTTESHHIIPIKDDPSQTNKPDNLILLCSHHHTLTQKIRPDGEPSISFNDIKDLIKSKYAKAEKQGFNFRMPENFNVVLGNNFFRKSPHIIVVNKKPLLEIWPQKPNHYSKDVRLYLYMRLFDEHNNFVGGMFANHWASVENEEWNIERFENEIKIQHKTKRIFVKFVKGKDIVNITGEFYFDGIKINATNSLHISSGASLSCTDNLFDNCGIIIEGNNTSASIMIGSTMVLAPCQHANNRFGANKCLICHGSGYVNVIPGLDGNPVPCKQCGSRRRGAASCSVCKGSGWAGALLY